MLLSGKKASVAVLILCWNRALELDDLLLLKALFSTL